MNCCSARPVRSWASRLNASDTCESSGSPAATPTRCDHDGSPANRDDHEARARRPGPVTPSSNGSPGPPDEASTGNAKRSSSPCSATSKRTGESDDSYDEDSTTFEPNGTGSSPATTSRSSTSGPPAEAPDGRNRHDKPDHPHRAQPPDTSRHTTVASASAGHRPERDSLVRSCRHPSVARLTTA